MKKRLLIQAASVAFIVAMTSGCIVINVSRSDEKKPKPQVEHEHEDVKVEKEAH